jgi:hypothetical protein
MSTLQSYYYCEGKRVLSSLAQYYTKHVNSNLLRNCYSGNSFKWAAVNGNAYIRNALQQLQCTESTIKTCCHNRLFQVSHDHMFNWPICATVLAEIRQSRQFLFEKKNHSNL